MTWDARQVYKLNHASDLSHLQLLASHQGREACHAIVDCSCLLQMLLSSSPPPRWLASILLITRPLQILIQCLVITQCSIVTSFASLNAIPEQGIKLSLVLLLIVLPLTLGLCCCPSALPGRTRPSLL
jgi:hypothetical protein